ncbi:MAG: Ig domain-containing protein, partial [Oscillospiraceae bacterium]
PQNAANTDITWSSANTEIAVIDDNGTITAKSPGSTNIIATAKDGSNITGQASLTVTSIVQSVTINTPSSTDVPLKGTLNLSVLVLPENATDKTIVWESSNTETATVDATGVVTGIKEGTVTITAKSKTVSATGKAPAPQDTIALTITAVKATGITLNNTAASLLIGSNLQMAATVQPGNATLKEVTWASSDALVASVDANGLITALKEGSATITATAKDGSGVKASIPINVQKTTTQPVTPVFRVMYNVNWGGHGTSMIDDQTGYTSGSSVTLRTVVPKRQGYTFTGWNTKADGTGTAYKPGAILAITQDTRLYAQWNANSVSSQPAASSSASSSSSVVSSVPSVSSSQPLPVASLVPPSNGAVVGRAFSLTHPQDGASGEMGWEWDSSYFTATFEGESASFTPLKGGSSIITYTNPDGVPATVVIQIAEAPQSGMPLWLTLSLCALGAAAVGAVVLVVVRAKHNRRERDEYQG